MFEKGATIYLPGSSGEPVDFSRDVLGATAVDVTTSFVPGVNVLSDADIGPDSRVTGFFMQSGMAESQRAGWYRHLPQSYYGTIEWLSAARPFDICVVQVTPPDQAGLCSMGPAAEFTPEVLRRARSIVAVVNPNVPRLTSAPTVPYSSFAQVHRSESSLVSYEVGDVDPATGVIARRVADFIPDKATLQTGLGKVPHAIMAALHGHRGLRLHSGMLSDGVIGLARSGALDPTWQHSATVLLGSKDLYDWAEDRTDIRIAGVETTHHPGILAETDRFIAVNTALEIDLFGQCNLELADGRAVSGSGGATDFARAGRLSRGGLSIVALPSTFGSGKGSRVRPWLGEGSMASLGRTDVDVIVTEEGAADLRGLSVHERAEAIISIATPSARSELVERWKKIAARL